MRRSKLQRLLRLLSLVALPAALEPLVATGAEAAQCGAPLSGNSTPLASDALFILRAAVGTQPCEPCLCDTDGSTAVSATDALLSLKVAVGQSVAMDCPPCSSTTTTLCSSEAPVVPALKIVAVNATAAGFATFAAQPPGSSDWYIVEQAGRIRIIRNGQFLSTPFLDIRDAIGTGLGERGLLGIAFHPDYASNGRFFTMATPGNGADATYAPIDADAVVEWRRNDADPDTAMPTKVRDIVVVPKSDSNHNGGTVEFGPDGYLYVGTGDGGGGCESSKPGAVQDTSTLFGKILRLDVDRAAPFAAPGNPFPSDARAYHYGLRNPFRFSFDRLTSDLFIGDVGQSAYEEISVAAANAAGKNFGWPAFEGAEQGTCGSKPLAGPSLHTPPILSIDRASAGPFSDYASVIGGRVYRGSAIPELRGVYLFADFYGNEIGALRYCDGAAGAPTAVPRSAIPASHGSVDAITSFAEGNDGELYVTYGSATRIGRIAPQ
jgi:glucose/arabinose dehydrogenase